jgi:protein gp37
MLRQPGAGVVLDVLGQRETAGAYRRLLAAGPGALLHLQRERPPMSQQREGGISWTEQTWNPIRGCSRVSEGCRNCYAERQAFRYSGPGMAYEGLVQVSAVGVRRPRWNGTVKVVEEAMLAPLHWKRPRRVFVNSMSDLFHENVTDATIDRIFGVMALAPQHTFQVLTKRPERMRQYMTAHGHRQRIYVQATLTANGDFSRFPLHMAHHRSSGEGWWPLPNVWLGVSVEDQKAADARIPLLLETPAAVRWISAEPLLGDINLHPFLCVYWHAGADEQRWCDLICRLRPHGLDWVVVGGESGQEARPMQLEWARALRDQCVTAGVAFHFKQWGEWAPRSVEGLAAHEYFPAAAAPLQRLGKKAAGRLLDGRTWDQYPKEE